MKISYQWLRTFVDTDRDPAELARLLTMQGVVVDDIEQINIPLDGIVVARVDRVSDHPNADRLSLCTISTGSESFRVVCGAPNVREGCCYPFAGVGTVIHDGTKIRKAKIRGEESEGMLLSGYEMGISDDRTGILELEASARPGTPLSEMMDTRDTVFLLDITANRMDLHSHLGVAREVAALEGVKVKLPQAEPKESSSEFSDVSGVTIDDVDGCPRYMARIVDGVRVGQSPSWLVGRLESIGQRSINSIVDVTNLILYELGTPLHAFDFDTLAEGKIVVRRAADGESFRTLDGEERKLTAEMTMIADARRSVAIGGVMGGEETEVSEATTRILIECAHFDPRRIRRTSQALSLTTEASYRFERWVDPSILPYAVDRAACLVQEVAGGSILAGRGDVYPNPHSPPVVSLRPAQVERVLGKPVETEEIIDLLERIELETTGSETLEVRIPMFRARDLTREIDLVEEVARLKGYDWIGTDYTCGVRVFGKIDSVESNDRDIREFFREEDFSEVISTSFVSADLSCQWLGYDEHGLISVTNPVNAEERFMRPLILSTLLPIVASNVRKRNRDVRIFELGVVFGQPEAGRKRPRESRHLAAAAIGKLRPVSWRGDSPPWDLFAFKGIVERFLLHYADEFALVSGGPSFLLPERCLRIEKNGDRIGYFGQVRTELSDALEVGGDLFVLEVDTGQLARAEAGETVTSVSRFPPLERDLSLVVPWEIPYDDIERVIRHRSGDLLEELRLFDLYHGGQIPDGKKGLSFTLVFRSPERTLEDQEVNSIIERTLESLRKELGVVLR